MAYHKGFKLSKTGLSIPHLHINRFVKKLRSDNGNEISSNDMNATNIHSWHHGLLFPVVLGLLFACGTNAAVFANIPVTSLAFWAQALLFSLLFMLTFRCCDKLVIYAISHSSISDHTTGSANISRQYHFEYCANVKSLLRNSLRFFVCWVPYLILLRPGIVYWDTGDQLAQYFGHSVFGQEPGVIWDHHPFLDTYLYGAFLSIGKSIFNSYNAGIFLFSLVQECCLAIACAYALRILVLRNLAIKVYNILACFLAFFPIVPITGMIMSKDVTYLIVFIVWTAMYVEIASTKLEKLTHPVFTTLFVIITLILPLTKKTGLAIVVFSLLFLVFIKHSKVLLRVTSVFIAVLAVLSTSTVVPNFIYSHTRVIKDDGPSAIVMPILMLARASHYHHSDISEEERAAIDGYLINDWDSIGKSYAPFTSDSVSGFAYQPMHQTSSFTDFAKAWIRVGLRHPGTYITSFFCEESGWITFVGSTRWTGSTSYSDTRPQQLELLTSSHTNEDTFGKVMPSNQPSPSSSFVSSIMNTARTTPVVNVLFSTAFWTAIIPCYLCYILWIRRKSSQNIGFSGIIPYLCSTILLFACPISLSTTGSSDPTRYALASVLFAPLMIGYVYSTQSDNTKSSASTGTHAFLASSL